MYCPPHWAANANHINAMCFFKKSQCQCYYRYQEVPGPIGRARHKNSSSYGRYHVSFTRFIEFVRKGWLQVILVKHGVSRKPLSCGRRRELGQIYCLFSIVTGFFSTQNAPSSLPPAIAAKKNDSSQKLAFPEECLILGQDMTTK